MLGTKYYFSAIEDEIYSMMEDYMLGMELYEYGLIAAITDYLDNYNNHIEWHLGCSRFPNDSSRGVCYVAWIEEGHHHMIGFDFKEED